MKYQHVNGYYVAGNEFVAIAINDGDPEDAHYFTPHIEAVDGIDLGAFDRAIAWTSPGA